MYDGGNYLSIRAKGEWREYLSYTQDCDGLLHTSVDVADVTYSTCKTMDGGTVGLNTNGIWRDDGDVSSGTLFAATFASASSAIDGIMISGNLGADGLP